MILFQCLCFGKNVNTKYQTFKLSLEWSQSPGNIFFSPGSHVNREQPLTWKLPLLPVRWLNISQIKFGHFCLIVASWFRYSHKWKSQGSCQRASHSLLTVAAIYQSQQTQWEISISGFESLNIWIPYWSIRESRFIFIKKQVKQASETCTHLQETGHWGECCSWWKLVSVPCLPRKTLLDRCGNLAHIFPPTLFICVLDTPIIPLPKNYFFFFLTATDFK